MNTTYEIIDEVLVRAGVSSTTATGGLYTDTILKDWLDPAHRWASAQRKWPFTEGRISTTYSQEENDYPEGWKPESIRLLTVGGKRYQKVTHRDYQRYLEDTSNGEDKVFTDFGLTYFINPNSDPSGSVTVYGQYTPAAIDKTDDAAKTVFSDRAPELNEAIVEEILSYAKKREKKPTEAREHHLNALRIIAEGWENVTSEQFGYQTKDRSMFKRFDVMEGVDADEFIRRDRWF